ncbi:MAG: hypothetical protein M1358_25145 [Chloroflexi bacterium]|nr:hypothetical protein [Chloroflexota bacterium]
MLGCLTDNLQATEDRIAHQVIRQKLLVGNTTRVLLDSLDALRNIVDLEPDIAQNKVVDERNRSSRRSVF